MIYPTPLKFDDVKKGDTVHLDAGFTCAPAGPVVIDGDDNGLFFLCAQGCHYIDGQINDDDTLSGMFAKDIGETK